MNPAPSVHPPFAGTERSPLVSIIILAYNQLDYTQKCLASIQEHTTIPYEAIVVDNASTDGTDEYLIKWRRQWQASQQKSANSPPDCCQRVKLILNSENLGYAVGNNQGMAIAEGAYVLLLNNDTVVTPNWLERLLAVAQTHPQVGLVGPVTNYISGPQRIAEVNYPIDSLEGLAEFATQWGEKRAGEIVYSWRVVGFCLLIKRTVLDKIGGLDTRYGIGNFEDDDFCIRAAIAGFQAAIAQSCFIHHFGSQSFKPQGKHYRQQLLLKNWEIFKQKWGIPADISYGSTYDISSLLQQSFHPTQHYFSLHGAGLAQHPPVPQILTPTSQPLRIDLGCGAKKPPGYIGVDIYPWSNVDIVADLTQQFPFPDSSVDEVRAHDFIEHLPDRIQTMNEIWRICKPNGKVDIFVPSTDGRGAFQDPTHVSYWNINSFMYYAVEFPAYLELCRSYGFKGAFSLVQLEHQESPGQVLHVRAILKAVKSGEIDESFFAQFNLTETNAIALPDWNQPEETLLQELENAIAPLIEHPHPGNITILIECSTLPENSDMQPDLILATIGLNLFSREDLESAEETPEISLIENPLTAPEWQALLPRLHYRIALPHENTELAAQIGLNHLPILE